MKKQLTFFTITIIIFCAISVIKHETTYAVNYISGASVNGHVGQPGHTRFRVNLHFTSKCSGEDIKCDQVDGKFPCIEHGDDYTSSICSNSEWAHSGNPQSDGWDYYEVVLKPCNSNEQNMQGTYRVRHRYTLTLRSIDVETQESLAGVTGLGDKTAKAWSGNKASVTRGDTRTGYTFVGFSPAAQGNTITKKLTSNVTVLALYRHERGESSTEIKVKNNDVEKHNTLKKDTYAKPGTIDKSTGDTLTYTAWYKAGAQTAVNWRPQYVQIGRNDSWSGACGGNNTVLTINTLFNQCRGSYNYWNNAFSVTKENFLTDKEALDYTGYGIGVTTGEPAGKNNDHMVIPQEVGSALIEHAVTNRPDNFAVWSTPKSYRIGLVNGSNTPSSGKVDITSLDATASAYIPYNFVNETHKPRKEKPDPEDPVPPENSPNSDNDESVDDDTNDKIVYSGEQGTFQFRADVNPRKNEETDGTYATIVRGAKWRLGLCIGNDCKKPESDPTKYNYSEEWGGKPDDTLNKDFKLEGQQGILLRQLTINIPDLTAGSRICVVAEVWPKDSGAETNWQISGYSKEWARSPKSCYTIAKRPSTQFWGGNIFTRGNINTTPSIKNNLYNYADYSYKADVKRGTFVFGSWGELGVVSNGLINGFGSGSSMGYATNDSGTLSPNPFAINTSSSAPNPGGGRASSFCDYAPLTIPNSPCEENGIKGLTSAVGITKAASDKQSIVEVLTSGESVSSHTHSDTDMVISKASIGDTIADNTMRVISSNGNITISANDGDLIYLNNSYLTFEQMPKLVIYAKNNIYIDCNINRIDALLIADNNVVTCNNFGDELTNNNITNHINEPANSRQLYINGTIIAKKLVANRTYGAAAGANSIIPAEIVNFDPTLYQFGGSDKSNGDATGRLDITNIYEVSPRI